MVNKNLFFALFFSTLALLLIYAQPWFLAEPAKQPAATVQTFYALEQDYKETWDKSHKLYKEWIKLEDDVRKLKSEFMDAEEADDKVAKAIEYFKSQKIADNVWENYVATRDKCAVILKKIESYVKERN